MTLVTWVLILMGVGLNAVAQLLLKTAARGLAHFDVISAETILGSGVILMKSVPFWVGMTCYAASVCVWIGALTKAPVSVAYPMLSLGYVVVAAIGAMWLGESLTLPKICGIALICCGVYFVSRSA